MLHKSNNFDTWKLPVSGLVNNPVSLSLAEIRALPSRTQITAHSCERGWTAIAQWTGVPLSTILDLVEVQPGARYVVFECIDGLYDSIDMFDAMHPQTILAYNMNGDSLPERHGAPIRLRVERHLGYKQVKFIMNVVVTDSIADFGAGKGSRFADRGWSWYAGI